MGLNETKVQLMLPVKKNHVAKTKSLNALIEQLMSSIAFNCNNRELLVNALK